MTQSRKYLKQIFNGHFPSIYRYFFTRIEIREISEDLTSDTFVKFANVLNKNRIENIEKYIWGIVHNVFNEYLRDKYKKREISYDEDILLKTDSYKSKDRTKEKEYILSITNKIPKKQAIIIRLILNDNLSTKEIMQKLHRSEDYVKTTRKRAVKSLRRFIHMYPLNN